MGFASYWKRYMRGLKDPEFSWHDRVEGLEVWYSFRLSEIHAEVLHLSFWIPALIVLFPYSKLPPTPALCEIK